MPSPLEPGLGAAQPKPNVRKTLDTTLIRGGMLQSPVRMPKRAIDSQNPRKTPMLLWGKRGRQSGDASAVNRKQRRMSAKLGHHSVAPFPSIAPSVGIAELLRRAVRHHNAGQLTEAEDYYRQVLAIDQNPTSIAFTFSAWSPSNRGAVTVRRSTRLIGRAIALNERDPAHNNRIAADLDALGRGKNSVGRHDLAVAYSNLSIALMALGNSSEALKAIQRSIRLEETENTKLLFVQSVRGLSSLPEGIDLRDNLARALSEPWGRPIELARFAANLIKRDGATGASIQRFISAREGSRRQHGIINDAEFTSEICRDRLLRCLLGINDRLRRRSGAIFSCSAEYYSAGGECQRPLSAIR